MKTLPRRVFNSPLVEFANFSDGSFINLIRLVKPYANGEAWAVYVNSQHPLCQSDMFKTYETAKEHFELCTSRTQQESTLIQKGPTGN